MTRILFVGKSKGASLSPILRAQAQSLGKLEKNYIAEFAIEGKGILAYLRAIPNIRRVLHRERIDLVHAHYSLSALSCYFAKGDLPLIISFMGDDLLGSHDFSGKSTLLGKIIKRLSLWLAQRADWIIVKSKEMSEQLPHIRHKSIIANGVNFNIFKQIDHHHAKQALNLSPTKPCLLFVADPGRPEKNYTLASDSALAAGIEDDALYSIYKVQQNQLVTWYNAADVLLMTSYHEGSPNVVKEALACNCPVVATPVGDVPELLKGQRNSQIRSYDPDDFGVGIKQVLETATRTDGRKRLQALGLDSESVAIKIQQLYEQVTKSKSNVRN